MGNLYSRIELLCKQKGINITVMCRDAGVTRGNLSDLKKGRTSSLSAKNLEKISSYFGVSMEYLLTGEQKEKPSVNDDEELEKLLEMYRTRPECRMLFSLANGATVEDVKKAAAIIEALRKVDGR